MTILDLTTIDGLREACLRIDKAKRATTENVNWTKELQEFLSWVAAADEANRSTLQFQERLWDHNPVSSPGQGNISMAAALADAPFRAWLAHESLAAMPATVIDQTAKLTSFYDSIVEKLKKLSSGKTPHLKIFRVLAAFYPSSFTTVAHRYKLRQVHERMAGPTTSNPVAWHSFVRGRISEALGSANSAPDENAWRMALPWYFYEAIEAEKPVQERVAIVGATAGEETLLPLPAARRRRGLTGIKGYFATLLTVMEFVKEGVSREELLDYLRTSNPDHKENTLRTVINILRSEFAVIKQVGDKYGLTDRGDAVLESGEASELGDWLVTRILGADHVLKTLESGPQSRANLLALLQRVHPGWTTTFAPNALLSWFVSFRALQQTSDGKLSLTSIGADWASLIHWEPEFLVEDPDVSVAPGEMPTTGELQHVVLPTMANIRAALVTSGGYPAETVENLHLGLWSPRIRHFAVLTGISGSGKTRLAVKYAEALTDTVTESQSSRLHIEAVQPAWYDPAPLLGYVSPLRDSSYTRTAFLNFLLRASSDPTRPYVAILDEMNLSHPEQYFAPLLSAMETGGAIRFHAEGESFDGVPGSVLYPANLAIIGTINMDETTHGLSDKVLDRAFTLEFSFVEMSSYPGWASRTVATETRERLTRVLTVLIEALRPVHMHFGWRVVDDVVDFVAAGEREPKADVMTLLDTAIYAKIIPKIRGDDNDTFRKALDQVQSALQQHKLVRSHKRVADLADDLRFSGSARFWR